MPGGESAAITGAPAAAAAASCPAILVEFVVGGAVQWRRSLAAVDDDMETRFLRAMRSQLDFSLDVPNKGACLELSLTKGARLDLSLDVPNKGVRIRADSACDGVCPRAEREGGDALFHFLTRVEAFIVIGLHLIWGGLREQDIHREVLASMLQLLLLLLLFIFSRPVLVLQGLSREYCGISLLSSARRPSP